MRSLTYEGNEEHCIYIDDGEGGALVQPNNVDKSNPLIVGEYVEYKQGGGFQTESDYNRFDEGKCDHAAPSEF